jgi:hypothetical protein
LAIGNSSFPRISSKLWTYDLESVSNNADSHDLLSVVATVHHDRVGQSACTVLTSCILLLCDQAQGADDFVPLNDGALCLAETLSSISAGGVREVDGRTDLDVVAVSKIVELAKLPVFHINQIFGRVFFFFRAVLDWNCNRGFTYVKEISLISTSSCCSLALLPPRKPYQHNFSRATHVAPFSEQLDGIGLDILGEG